MPVSPKRRRAPAPSAGSTRTAATRSITEQVGDLAWAGQHAAAIALASRSLDGGKLPPEERLAGLSPAQQILALSDDVLRGLPETYIHTLPPDVQDTIRKRIGH